MPGDPERERKTREGGKDEHLQDPGRGSESGQGDGGGLHDQPGGHGVGGRDTIDLSLLQTLQKTLHRVSLDTAPRC